MYRVQHFARSFEFLTTFQTSTSSSAVPEVWSQALAKAHAAQNGLANIDREQVDCEELVEWGLELLFERFVHFCCERLAIFFFENVYTTASVRLLDKVGSLEDWDDDVLEIEVDNILSQYCPSSFVEAR